VYTAKRQYLPHRGEEKVTAIQRLSSRSGAVCEQPQFQERQYLLTTGEEVALIASEKRSSPSPPSRACRRKRGDGVLPRVAVQFRETAPSS